jgi:RNase P protein component
MIVSRHLLRRRARAKAARLERLEPGNQYTVVAAKRGPARWYVESRPRA